MYSENPLCEQRNTYSPGGSCSTRYAPPDCAFTVLGCISVGPETSIVAPSSVAPDGSEAIPVMRPVMATCAITVEPGSRDRSSRIKKRTCRMAGISLCGVPRHWGRGAVKGQTLRQMHRCLVLGKGLKQRQKSCQRERRMQKI